MDELPRAGWPNEETAPPGVAERLARDIQAGRFQPGSWLKQIELQRRYGANRSEIRKALEHLASKRLIQYLPNRGYFVHREDDAVAAEIRDIRIMLETSAAEFMARNAAEHHVVELETLAKRFAALLDAGTMVEIYEVNLAFHRALLATTGNHSLVELVSELRLRTSPAPASQWSTRRRMEQSAREHFEIVEALRARDVARLHVIIERHISQPETEEADKGR
ncbi:GntR family transcriptional regulator [Consotaella salsifontis]|uniref:DNA-binding transcriptional regulator, GntR family n=1 Tax=Consotaella salsifontis TaxID=1365950 RepID=A0A1T4SDB1_9HYPH|nr:GntR family transcriptional regulator [Consotaella salsifontis]SKA26212.1 DNA-binding transcriptional regulator, GntR family [Consotaella salsifontis]